jgi:predicted signal transduction protein with EAL and GGDEF domain
MQLKMNSNYRPLLITAGLAISGNALSFSYQDCNYIDSNNNIEIVNQNDYVTELSRNLFYKAVFEGFYEKWEKQTRFSSSAKAIVENENFQSIVAMKENAVPFIVNKLEEEPSLLVWALNLIFNEKVSHKNISIEEAGKLWLKKLQA